MIFITLGSQKFQFNRLLEAVDNLIANKVIQEKVFAQTGYSDYVPQNYEYKEFLNRDEFLGLEKKADIVITHGGTGAIIGAVKNKRKVIAIPRLSRYGEHVDDHQVQIVNQFRDSNLIYSINDCDSLGQTIKYVKNHKFNTYKSNSQRIINNIDRYIEENI